MLRIIAFMTLTVLLSFQGLFGQKEASDIELQSKSFKRLVDRSIDFSVPLIGVKDLYRNQEDYIILDAREKSEYEVSHIPGAIHVGYENPELDKIKSLDKDKKLLFYCSIGYRSEKIGEKAQEMGFDQVYNLYGSIFEWVNEGYELEDSKGESTKKVHAYNWIWGRWIKNKEYDKVYDN